MTEQQTDGMYLCAFLSPETVKKLRAQLGVKDDEWLIDPQCSFLIPAYVAQVFIGCGELVRFTQVERTAIALRRFAEEMRTIGITDEPHEGPGDPS